MTHVTHSTRVTSFLLSLCLVSISVALALFLQPALAHAKPANTWTVESTADGAATPGNCNGAGCRLRDALAAASNGDTIAFSLTLPATITLVSGTLPITANLAINGPGQSNLSISGDNSVRMLDIGGVTLNLNNLTLKNGFHSGEGGAMIVNVDDANVTVTSVTFFSNSTNAGTFGGGAISQNSTSALTISGSTFMNNNTDGGCCGGALWLSTGTFNITNTTFMNNSSLQGGAIHADSGKLTVSNSTFMTNTATGDLAGAISTKVPTTITNSSFTGNISAVDGGAIGVDGSATTIINSTFSHNVAGAGAGAGGAIRNGSTLTLTSSTVYSNTAFAGAGIASIGNATLVNDTLSGNAATSYGGGIAIVGGTVRITNTTIVSNTGPTSSGGGIDITSATVALKNTLLAGNGPTGNCSADAFTSNGGNLSSDSSCSTWFTQGNDQNDVSNPRVGPLANNGGATQTHALLPGSPAIDAGSDSGCPSTDQRGWHRPFGTHCDIGAYERGAFLYLPLILR